mmetsp:Transcript_18836/g.56141  ORF Transcript_18836/g.56141 Transcript_18836/m.56141 type:complete len:314 (+) Transcript_18836:887-1828(+)
MTTSASAYPSTTEPASSPCLSIGCCAGATSASGAVPAVWRSPPKTSAVLSPGRSCTTTSAATGYLTAVPPPPSSACPSLEFSPAGFSEPGALSAVALPSSCAVLSPGRSCTAASAFTNVPDAASATSSTAVPSPGCTSAPSSKPMASPSAMSASTSAGRCWSGCERVAGAEAAPASCNPPLCCATDGKMSTSACAGIAASGPFIGVSAPPKMIAVTTAIPPARHDANGAGRADRCTGHSRSPEGASPPLLTACATTVARLDRALPACPAQRTRHGAVAVTRGVESIFMMAACGHETGGGQEAEVSTFVAIRTR